LLGEESERENLLLESGMILEASSPLGIQQPEDICLIARARAVGVMYEFAQPDAVESEDARRKRQRQNQRRVADEERRLCEVVGDLPPPPSAGSSQVEDNAYYAICAFELEQMTYNTA